MEMNESQELLTTSECAELLRRSEQTLRVWAMNESGPISPVRTKKGAPLLWRRRDIESLICGTMNENTNSHN